MLFAFYALTLAGSSYAQKGEQSYAVLIVGDEGDADMRRLEKILINEMGKHVRAESADERLPIYSYHFNKERERAYCESKLDVLSEDLLFVGVVTLENKVPQKVIYRIDRIVNAPRAAKDILERADELAFGEASLPKESPTSSSATGNNAATAPASKADPGEASKATPSKTPDASAASPEGFRIQLGSFTSQEYASELKVSAEKAGFNVSVVSAVGPDGDALFKVLSAIRPERLQAEELLAKFKSAGFSQAFLIRADKK